MKAKRASPWGIKICRLGRQDRRGDKGAKLTVGRLLAKKGDVFIWHANLIHRGMPVKDTAKTRKSMVIHYYAKDVVKYHEIQERPSLLK